MGDRGSLILNTKLLSNFESDAVRDLFDAGISWQKAISDFLICWFDNSDSITVQTSGSTGKPKAIELKKASMRNSARMTNAYFNLNEKSVALLCLPADYIAGKMMLVRAIVGGFNLICVELAANPFANLSTSIDFTAITPYQFVHSLDEIKKLENNKINIRNTIIGGAKIETSLINEIQQFSGRFFETYGMTETCSHIALRQLNGLAKTAYFKVLRGVQVRTDENSCLCIHAAHLSDIELHTTDIVELITSETFLWKGRLDNIINTGGVKINPEEVARKLDTFIHKPFFISSIPDNLLGNKLILVIESDAYTSNEKIFLKAKINEVLDKFEKPKSIYYIPAFQYTLQNKLLIHETLKLLEIE